MRLGRYEVVSAVVLSWTTVLEEYRNAIDVLELDLHEVHAVAPCPQPTARKPLRDSALRYWRQPQQPLLLRERPRECFVKY